MITARIENNELITKGQPIVDEVYPGVCCEGFGWEIVYTNLDPATDCVMGYCQNPNCPMPAHKGNDPYGMIHQLSVEDMGLYLAGDGRISDRCAAKPDPAGGSEGETTMTHEQQQEWDYLVSLCKGNQFGSINVASKSRRAAIVAADERIAALIAEIERLRAEIAEREASE